MLIWTLFVNVIESGTNCFTININFKMHKTLKLAKLKINFTIENKIKTVAYPDLTKLVQYPITASESDASGLEKFL